MNKYNLAFIPKLKSKEFISLTEQYTDFHHNYILGKNSIPHVTVCQFYCEVEHLEVLCKRICIELPDKKIDLLFKTVSHLTFDGRIYWLSLLPENTEQLHRIFNTVSKFIVPLRMDAYDPHLTLFNYSSSVINLSQFLNTQINISDEFELAVGRSDDVGQLMNVIKII